MHSKWLEGLLSSVQRRYLLLFNWIAKTRLQKQDLDARVIHTHLITVLSTGALMWAYAVVAVFTISHPLPGRIGLAASLIHAFSPAFFAYSNSSLLVCGIMLGSGMAHQMSFAYFSGGFSSPLLIWFGILPMLAGILCGRSGVALWSTITVLVAAIFLYLQIQGHVFPNLISPLGLLISQTLMVFGWIFLSTAIIGVHLLLQSRHEWQLIESKRDTHDLLQILTHDLKTPISVIAIALTELKNREEHNASQALDMLEQAHSGIVDITGNVYKLFTLELDNYKMNKQTYSLNQSVKTVSELLRSKMAQKQISLRYDFDKNQELKLFLDPSTFNYQIMTNILSNAIKFSFSNSHIDIVATKLEDSIRLCIQDHGIGMPDEMVEQLFNVDSKTTRVGTRGESGTGYGMLIMQRSLHRLKGRIVVQSKERMNDTDSGGTRIILELPIAT